MHPHLAHIGPVTIPTFGAVAAAGLVLAILLAARGARIVRISEDAVWNLCLFSAAGTLLLSRLIIVAQVPKSFLHYPMYILTLPTVTKYGLLAAVLSGIGYALYKRLPLLRTADALAPAVLLLQAALHLGGLFAGDDLGSPTPLRIGQWIAGDRGYHPVALYSAVLSLLAAAIAFAFLRLQRQSGETFGLGLTLAALIRFFVDQFRPDYVLPDAFVGNFLRVDQLVLIALATAGICFFFQRGRTHAQ
ncbi:MAG: prolipoprotein diacylglyceryl transferase family protein [Janthinobacterium lividum]